MKPVVSRSALILSTLLFLIAFCMPAVQAADLFSGRWMCSAKGTSNGDVEFTLELSKSGDKMTGTLTVGGDSITLEDVSVDGNKLDFSISSPEGRYTSSATVESDNLKGTWKDENGNSGGWEGQKEK
jgi:hypothetical protein